MLAATVLARYVDTVTVLDRDRFPDGPELRKGCRRSSTRTC
ncbi:hypothetical protein NKH77_11430 [Streptomyces sp. M19]